MKRFMLVLLMVLALCVIPLSAGPPVVSQSTTMAQTLVAWDHPVLAAKPAPSYIQANAILGTLAVLMSGFLASIYLVTSQSQPSKYLRRQHRHIYHARDRPSLTSA